MGGGKGNQEEGERKRRTGTNLVIISKMEEIAVFMPGCVNLLSLQGHLGNLHGQTCVDGLGKVSDYKIGRGRGSVLTSWTSEKSMQGRGPPGGV